MKDEPKPLPQPDSDATFTPVSEDATFEPINDDENGGGESESAPIANAKPRFRDMFDRFSQGVRDIRPFVPHSMRVFHGIANALAILEAPKRAKEAREDREANRDRISRQSEARIARDEAYTNFLKSWGVPPEMAAHAHAAAATPKMEPAAAPPPSAPPEQPAGPDAPPKVADSPKPDVASIADKLVNFPGAKKLGLTPAILKSMAPDAVVSMAKQLGIDTPAPLAAAAASVTASPKTPGPASAPATTPGAYAGVLASSLGGAGGANSNGSELRDILAVLREILDALKQAKTAGPEDDDESESIENRRPKFIKRSYTGGDSPMPQRGGSTGAPSAPSVSGRGMNRQHLGETVSGVSSMIRMVAEIASAL